MDEETYDDLWPERPRIDAEGAEHDGVSEAGTAEPEHTRPTQGEAVGIPTEGPPPQEPPLDEPVQDPPTDEAPVDEPTVDTPPWEEPPAQDVPVQDPPASSLHFEEQPFETPLVEQPPTPAEPVASDSVSESALFDAPLAAEPAVSGWIEEFPEGGEVAAGSADLPARDERDFVESQQTEPGLDSIAASLADDSANADVGETTEDFRPKTSHVGEEVVILGSAAAGSEDTAIVGADGTVLAAPQAEAEPLPAMDMGPERRGNIWVWVGVLVGFLLMAGALGFAWWYFNERPVEVPNVVGRLPAQAAQALNDSGLRLGKVTETPTDTAPVGTVIVQSPEYGAKTKPGEAVSLVIAGSPEMSKVPAVTGVSAAEASRVLANARLSTHVVESYSSTAPVGFVQSQSPSAGAEAEPGSVVAVMISRGAQPATFRVPKLIGMSEADAGALIGTIEVRAEVFRSFDNSLPAGVVMDQYPLADTQVPFDGVVQYLVCKGPGINNTTVPDVVGSTSDRAIKRLKETDLKAKVSFQPSGDVPKGEVIAQLPAARTRTSAGETVGLVVSSGTGAAPTIPDVRTKTSDEASKALRALGYRALSLEVRTTSQPAGKAYGQLPAAGVAWPSRYPVLVLIAAP